ncbi:transposase [Streptomyces pseudogriseolus]
MKGRALIDRELYLPTSWTEDPVRRTNAKIDEEVAFRTEPVLARTMLGRAGGCGEVPVRWLAGDEVSGQDTATRSEPPCGAGWPSSV